MKKLLILSRRRGLLLLGTVGLSLLALAVSLWWNALLGGIIDGIGAGEPPGKPALMQGAAAVLLSAGLACGLKLLTGWTCETLAHDLRMGYARRLASLPAEELEDLNAGEQLSRLQNELGDVSDYLKNNLFQLADQAVRFVGTAAFLLWLNPELTLWVYLPCFLILAYVFFSSRVIQSAARQTQQKKLRMNGFADTLLTLFPLVRLYDAADLLRRGYREALGQWREKNIRLERARAGLMSLSALLACIPTLLLLLLGGAQVLQGKEHLGTLYVFLNLSGNVSGVFTNMPGYLAAFRGFSANMERLEPWLLVEEE